MTATLVSFLHNAGSLCGITSFTGQGHSIIKRCSALTVTLFLIVFFSVSTAFGQCTINAGADVSICNGQSTTLKANQSGACIAPFTFTWTSDPPGGPYLPKQSIIVSPTVTTVFIITFSDASSGPYIDSVTVTVNALPVPTIAGLQTTCNNVPGNIYTTQPGMSGYTWTISGGTITAGLGTNTITVTWKTVGAQQLTVSYTDGNGCTSAAPTIYPVTVEGPTLTGPVVVCKGSTNNIYTTEPGKGSYTWVVSFGAVITAGGGNGDNTITLTWTVATNGFVKVTYVVNGTCTTFALLPVIIYTIQPGISGPAFPCLFSNVTYLTEPGMLNYIWVLTNPRGTITDGGTPADDFVTINWLLTGKDTITCLYTNPAGCTAPIPTKHIVDVSSKVAPLLTENHVQVFCFGNATGSVDLTVNGGTLPLGYLWTAGGGGIVPAGQANLQDLTGLVAGTYTVVVSASDGCTTTLKVIITQPPSAVSVNAGSDSPVCEGATLHLLSAAAGGVGTYSYGWTGPNSYIANIQNPSIVNVTLAASGTYTVKATDANGCQATSNTVVTIDPKPVTGLIWHN